MFQKAEGLENDFIVVLREEGQPMMTSAAAARLCDRRKGIGADGVLTVTTRPSSKEDGQACMHVYNADGSEAEMCGNGLRCVVAVLADRWGRNEWMVNTAAGLRPGAVLESGQIRVSLGQGQFLGAGIATVKELQPGAEVSMGNPHLVIEVSGEPRALAERYGKELEHHPKFPARVNVGFARVRDQQNIDLVVHERGSGITQACGTGAGAAALAVSLARSMTEASWTVHLPGGPLGVDIERAQAPGQHPIFITGPARLVFSGVIELPPDEWRETSG